MNSATTTTTTCTSNSNKNQMILAETEVSLYAGKKIHVKSRLVCYSLSFVWDSYLALGSGLIHQASTGQNEGCAARAERLNAALCTSCWCWACVLQVS